MLMILFLKQSIKTKGTFNKKPAKTIKSVLFLFRSKIKSERLEKFLSAIKKTLTPNLLARSTKRDFFLFI